MTAYRVALLDQDTAQNDVADLDPVLDQTGADFECAARDFDAHASGAQEEPAACWGDAYAIRLLAEVWATRAEDAHQRPLRLHHRQ